MRAPDPVDVTPATDVLADTTAPAITPSSSVQPRIAGYTVQRLLGRGGMGEVWLAEHVTLHRTVALKVLRSDLTRDQAFAERFLREARATARINHPGVIAVHDAGRAGDSLYLAMEYMPGGDLRSRIAPGRGLPLEEALRLCLEIAGALQAIHDAGLVHRDLKPENILLGGDGRIRIADLGLARSEQGDDRMTATGMAMGTPAYMSPEQAEGAADIDVRSDVYALGATLFALLCGRPPFIGATPWVVVAKVMDEAPPDVRQFAPEVPTAVAVVVRRALSKDRARRHPSAQAFADELRRAREKGSSPAPVPARFVRVFMRKSVLVGILVIVVISVGILLARSGTATSSDHPPTTTTTGERTPNHASSTQTTEKPTPSTKVDSAVQKSSEHNPLLAIRDGFREVRTAVRGTLTEKVTTSVHGTAAAARLALRHQGLTLLKDRGDDQETAIETRLTGGDNLTITLRADGTATAISIQVGAFGDQEKSREVLGWIKAEL
jgi:serine/threonine protein kinase